MSYSRHSRHFELSRKWLLILGSVLIATFIGLFFHGKAQALEPKNNVNLYLFGATAARTARTQKKYLSHM